MRTKRTEFLYRLGLTLLVLQIVAFVLSFGKQRWFWGAVWLGPNGRYLLLGLPVTLLVSLLALAAGAVLGVAAGLGRLSRHLVPNHLATMYVEVIRGTPLLVQLLIAYFCVSQVTGIQDKFTMGVLALAFFSGAYVAEIVRAGIESVPRGQMEAARSLGMSHRRAMFRIIGPQALRNALPPLAGQFINLVKDSSLLMIIGVAELTKRADEVTASTYAHFEVLLPLAGLYLAMTLPLSLFTQWLEKRLGGDSRGHHL